MTTIDRPPSVLSHNWPHLPTYHISGHSVLVPHLWVLRRQMLECAVARGWIYNVTQHANTTHYPVRSLFFVFGTPFFVNRCPPARPPPPAPARHDDNYYERRTTTTIRLTPTSAGIRPTAGRGARLIRPKSLRGSRNTRRRRFIRTTTTTTTTTTTRCSTS